MGIQREPGQKGVNWSNIAVGERPFASSASEKWEHSDTSFIQAAL